MSISYDEGYRDALCAVVQLFIEDAAVQKAVASGSAEALTNVLILVLIVGIGRGVSPGEAARLIDAQVVKKVTV